MTKQESSKQPQELELLRAENAALSSQLAMERERRQQLEKAFQHTEKIKQVLDSHSVYIITDPAGMVLYANEGFCQLSHYSKQELEGNNANLVSAQYHTPDFWTELWQTISQKKVWQGEIKNKAKDGCPFWIEMIIIPILDQQGHIAQYLAIRKDITLDKLTQAQLRLDAYILSHVQDAVVGLDAHYRVNYWNQGAQRQYGLSAQQVIGKPLSHAYESIWLRVEDESIAMQSLAQHGSCSVEIKHKIKWGSKAGKELYVEATTQVLFNERGEQIGLLAVIRDVSQRKKAAEVLEHTLQELEKRNHELDNYVYKVSHDLRAPLTSMQGLLNLIKLEKDEQAKGQYLHLIENRVGKLDEYIQSILHHSQMVNAALEIKPIDFEKIIKECFEELSHYSHWQQVELNIQTEGHPSFYSDEFRLTVILKNIITNAIKYRSAGVLQSYLHFYIHITPARVLIRAKDNGVGIEEQYLNKIFEMFFRATASAQGSGLGLYIVRQAVDKLGGSIKAESRKGAGTTFYIDLPNLSGSAPAAS